MPATIDTLIELRQVHKAGKMTVGVDLVAGKNVELNRLGILEPLRVLKQAVSSATDAAVMVLRVDDVIILGPSEVTRLRAQKARFVSNQF